jgi:hypothetical protein
MTNPLFYSFQKKRQEADNLGRTLADLDLYALRDLKNQSVGSIAMQLKRKLTKVMGLWRQ